MWRVFLLLLILIFVADLILSQISGSLSYYFHDHIPAIISGGLILILAGIKVNFFSYEDEYEIIHIHSKSLMFSSFESPAQTRYEFPKRIIYDYEYKQSFLQKKLTIYLITQQGVERVRKFNLTFVPLRKLRYVISSLENIRKENEAVSASTPM